jgi:hypothetical protein
MDFQQYQLHFQSIINSDQPKPPYNEPDYLNYAKLNWSRQQRWIKVAQLNPDLVALVKRIDTPQQWIVITEPWCGDAAHTVPFIFMLSQQNPLINLDIQLRDTEPYLIDSYLSGQSKSIPKFVIRDMEGKDLLVWGPRPAESQVLFDQLKASGADFEEYKIQLQHWYNKDKGVSFQEEIVQQFNLLLNKNLNV